jgi:hypothetical protein
MATTSLAVPDQLKHVPASTAETDSALVEAEPDNSSKLKTFLGILRRFVSRVATQDSDWPGSSASRILPPFDSRSPHIF